MILDTTNISSETSGTVVVEKWVWEWYQDALNIAKTQLLKLEVANKELREQAKHRGDYTEALYNDYRDKCVEARALAEQVERLKQENKRLAEDVWRVRERKEQLERECNRLTNDVDKHWEYLEDVILGLADASDRVRQVAQEIKESRGIA